MSDMEAEVEEVSFLPGGGVVRRRKCPREVEEGEKILNKKEVYEPSASQRCRQMVCTRRWTVAILALAALFILLIAIVAAFARPGSYLCQSLTGDNDKVHGGGGGGTTEAPPHTTTPPAKDYIATDGSKFPWEDIRLPRSVIPEEYEIFLHPNLSESNFVGKVRIRCAVVSPTDFVVFHLEDLEVTGVHVLRGEVAVGVERRAEYKANQQVYVGLSERLSGGSVVTLVVDFKGKLVEKLAGFYKSSYTTRSGEKRYIATTHFEPTDARSAFPCFDEPDLKANFSLSIVREPRHVTLFNMPLKSSVPFEGGLVRDDYQMSVKMSTYLVAFVVCDFKNVTGHTKKQNTMVRVFAPEDQIDQAQYSLDVAVKVLDHYDDFFGVPYPLPKQDLIAIPDFGAGAMENWGLITFRATSLLYDPQTTSPSSKQWIAITVAHELAHQWFGNIVTMTWWDDLWLNEGFAAFVENIGASVAEPTFKLDEQFVLHKTQRALHLDALSNSHPIKVKVTDPAQINEIFDTISYDKGASIIAMLQGFLGEEAFKRGLREYLIKHSYGNAKTDDLWDSLQHASDMPPTMTVKDVMDTWTLQMGFPVVTVRPKPGTPHLTLTQHRFLLVKAAPTALDEGHEEKQAFKSPFDYTWKVPVTYRTKINRDKKLVWLKDKEMTLPVTVGDQDWIKLNLDTKGFYVVNYDPTLWAKIIQQLNANHTVFSARDRAGLLFDAFVLARAGELSYDVVFDLLGYLKKETEYVPLRAAIGNYNFIPARMYVSPAYPQLQKFLLGLITDQLNSLGWEQQSEPLNEFLQTLLLSSSIQMGHKENKEKALQLFKDAQSVPKNLQSMVWNSGVKYGDDSDWLKMFRNYSDSHIPTEKRDFLTALTYTTDPRRIQLFLSDALNSTIVRSQDTGTVLQYIGGSDAGQLFAWRFIQQNWDSLYKRYGKTSFTLGGILTDVIAAFNTQFDYDEVTGFFHGKELGAGSRGLKQSLEMVQSHVQWISNNTRTIQQWLDRHAQQR